MPVTNLDSFSAERLSDPEVIVNPYPYYDLLRERSPIFGYRDFPPGTVPGVGKRALWEGAQGVLIERIA